jgi:AcrR family transcriptional regulator
VEWRYGVLMATQAERSAATTAALRRAARTLFGRDGFDAVAVDGIAAAAGLTRGAFYHHYAGKEAIFAVVYEEIQAELAAAVRKAAAAHEDGYDQLRYGVDRYLELASDRRRARITLLDGPVVLGPARYQELQQIYFQRLVGGSLARLREGTPQQHALTARALMAGVCSLATHVAQHRGDLDLARAVAADLLGSVVSARPAGAPAARRRSSAGRRA